MTCKQASIKIKNYGNDFHAPNHDVHDGPIHGLHDGHLYDLHDVPFCDHDLPSLLQSYTHSNRNKGLCHSYSTSYVFHCVQTHDLYHAFFYFFFH